MYTIGIRELKAQLSRVLRQVQSGETVLVTDRGRVVAEMRSPGAAAVVESHVDRAFARMAATGELRLPERPAGPYERSPIVLPAGTAQQLLDEERGE